MKGTTHGNSLMALALLFGIGLGSARAEGIGETLKKIQDTGTVTLGYREYSMPISYVDNHQQPMGYAIDICRRIVDTIKTTLKMPDIKIAYQAVSGPNRIPLVLNGAVDLECGTTTNTKERERQVAFGPTYFVSNITAIAKTSANIKTLADLKGKNVAVSAGTTTPGLVTAYSQQHQLNIRQVVAKDNAEAFLLLSNDRVSAFALDDIVLYTSRANAADPRAYAVLTNESLRSEPYSVVFRKDDPEFKKVVDTALTSLITSGEIEKIYDKWFMSPIAPNNVNLQFPISPELRQAFEHPSDAGI